MKRKISISFDKEVDMGYIYFRKFLDVSVDPKSNIETNFINLENFDVSEEIDCGDYVIILDINVGGFISGVELFNARKRFKEIFEENIYNEIVDKGIVIVTGEPSEILNKLHYKEAISKYKV